MLASEPRILHRGAPLPKSHDALVLVSLRFEVWLAISSSLASHRNVARAEMDGERVVLSGSATTMRETYRLLNRTGYRTDLEPLVAEARERIRTQLGDAFFDPNAKKPRDAVPAKPKSALVETLMRARTFREVKRAMSGAPYAEVVRAAAYVTGSRGIYRSTAEFAEHGLVRDERQVRGFLSGKTGVPDVVARRCERLVLQYWDRPIVRPLDPGASVVIGEGP